MCGITGILSKNKPISDRRLNSMCSVIAHRGPDDSGVFKTPHCGLGHRRLSIIDLTETGHQPMVSDDGNVILIFNGEIYNYKEIKKELGEKGYSFKGTSDTETILNGYLEWGINVLEKLNGIFTIGIQDLRKATFILARDRFGVKPLYYFYDNESFLFGSEIKTILKGGVSPLINYQSLHEFLFYGFPLAERTMLKNVNKLLPGYYLEINTKTWNYKTKTFWKHEYLLPELGGISESEAIDKLRYHLESAVTRQLLSDVPVGVFLSGGIDSSAITAFASKHYEGSLNSYTAGFDFNKGQNELSAAKKIAQKFGTNHHELIIKGADLPKVIEKMVYHHDQPFSDAANIPLYLLTNEVKGHCKVILQGDGGDEMFGGYSRYHILKKYKQYKLALTLLNPIKKIIPSRRIRNQIERFAPIFSESIEGRAFAKLLTVETEERNPIQVLSKEFKEKISRFNPFEYYEVLAKRFENLSDLPQKMLWIDSLIILPDQFLEKVDKSTMASSVEVRVPFLDNELSSYAMRLPSSLKLKNGVKKYILKKALEGLVPNEVLYAPKKGFGVPVSNWLKGPLNEYMRSKIDSHSIRNLGIFNHHFINDLIDEHQSEVKNNGFLLWKLLNLSIWLQDKEVQL